MIFDDREGSKQYAAIVNRCARTRVARLGQLDFGDLFIVGKGEGGRPVRVGIEIKKIRDLLASMQSGRLMGTQLPGMAEDYDERYLIVEGFFRYDWRSGGRLVTKRNATSKWIPITLGGQFFDARALEGFLLSVRLRFGVRVWRTLSETETAHLALVFNHAWTKPWDLHKSHLAFHQLPVRVSATDFRPTLLAKVASSFPGLGPTRARAAAKKFKNPREMVCASMEEWKEVEGVGTGIAKNLVRMMKGG